MNQPHPETHQADVKASIKTDQIIVITKSTLTNSYIVKQPMSYDFYLLYTLFTESLSQMPSTNPGGSISNFEKNAGIDFYKKSSMQCLVTSKLFINKNNGYIELFSIYDLANTDDLCLPKSPKFIMTAKNFMNFMVQKNKLLQELPRQFFIVIDTLGHAHLTTDLQSLEKKSFFTYIQKKIAGLFSRPSK